MVKDFGTTYSYFYLQTLRYRYYWSQQYAGRVSYELRSRLGSLWNLCGSVVRASERGIRRSQVRFLGTFSLSLLVTRRKNILRSQWADFYCGSNSSADSEMTAFDGRIVHNRINGFTRCHGIFRTGFVRTPLPEFSTHQENKLPLRWHQSHYVIHEVRFFKLFIKISVSNHSTLSS